MHLLRALGADPVITNPTPTPPRFAFLLHDLPGVDRTAEAVKEIRRADLILVLDIADLGRLGMLHDAVRDRGVPVACIDHHVSEGTLPPGPRYVDAQASATGELVVELAEANEWEIPVSAARALYVAVLTDTGGFRFSNTRPRVLRVAADLLESGVDPEEIYLEVYANVPEGRHRLLAEALETLVVEPGTGLAWITVPPVRWTAGACRPMTWTASSSSPVDRGRPDGAPLPGNRPGTGKGVAAVGGGRGRGEVCEALWGRRSHEGRGTVRGGEPPRGTGDRTGRRPGVSRCPRTSVDLTDAPEHIAE